MPPALLPRQPRWGGSCGPSMSTRGLGCHDDWPRRLSGSQLPKAGVCAPCGASSHRRLGSLFPAATGASRAWTASRATAGKAGATPEDEGYSGWTCVGV